MPPEKTIYQCNVQNPNGGENLGCGALFESKDSLPPSERLCPKCRGKKG